MTSQRSSFSPQVILERLTGEQVHEGPVPVSLANLDRPARSNLHALVIGINEYLHHSHLKGAVNDANLFKSYLLNDLFVPETQITTLFDTQATRSQIIKAFQNLATDQNIKHGDPIVIYYAGHGAEVQPPPSHHVADGSRVQSLVPQDAGTTNLSSAAIPPIPDFTISSLLNRIANAKGDNLTVIFDSCHSASITRIGRGRGSRSIPSLCFAPLPEDIDSEIIAESLSIATRSLRTSQNEPEIRGMQSHVLLAACSSKGLAYEDLDTTPHHGYFTTALLKILRSVGPARLTYKSCIQRMPKLESSTPQDPVCEGINVNRMFFNAMASGADSSFILLEEKRSELYLQAGAVHGITPGCLFAIHADLILDPANPPLGTMIVHQVTPFRSLLKIGDDTPSFAVPKPAYGRQIGTGNEHALDIYITPEFENVIPPDPRWEVAFSGKEKDVVLRLVERDMAALIVDVDDNSWATFTLPRLKPAVKYGITTLKRAVPTEFQDVYHVISSAARFIWHLERFPQSRPFQAGVKVEFYKLKESGKYEETGSPILEIDGDDLNERGVARVTVDNEDRYGFHIINTTSRDLYAYLFYFSVTTLAITSKFLPVIGSGQVDPSLPIGATLPLGYGSGGVKPFQFSLKRGEPLDVGVFKLFLATAPIDLGSIEQPLPFRIEPRRLIGENEAKHQFATLQVGIWDAITMELELTEPPETSSFVEPGVNSPPTWDEAQKGVSKPASPFDYLTAEKQHALLKDFKLTCGLTIDSDYGPRFSDRSVSVLTRPASELFGFHNTTITEEVVSSSMLDAVFAHNGFPPLNNMSNLPLLDDLFVSNDGAQKWTTRRMIIGKLDFSASTEDFLPNVEFISDVQDALNHSKDWQKLKALKDVVETWGVVIPLSGVIGYSSVATEIDRKPDWPRPPPIEELESNNYDNSRMVKVTRVASILELLEDSLQDQVKQLYASLIFRSPCVGMHQLFGFDGTMNQGRQMEEIEIGFSDLRIESIVVRYRGGHVVGPYGISGMPTQFERFSIDRDEGITDILVWAADSHISSLQILESSGRASPIYGTKKGITQPPKLLSGNGCFLVGLSGGFDKFGVTQIQAVWRGDTHTKGYRCKQTSHVGGKNGTIWSDLTLLANPLNSRISSITASIPSTWLLGGLQTTYTSLVNGFLTSQSTPIYGIANSPTVTWELDEEEWIIGVRGRHDGKTICELQFVTNRLRSSPAFGQPFGDIHFDIKAPKTSERESMVLHYMAGKSDESVNSILFVWAEPVDWQTLQPGLIVIPPLPPDHELNPRATFYNLCAKAHDRTNMIGSLEENSRAEIITRPTGVKPPLHALVIGINKYQSYNHLVAAVPDALNFKLYLTQDLLVPEEQIKLLLDEQATKWNIILALRGLSCEDNGIKLNDPIVIYYAGYGGEVDPPPDQVLNRPAVQCIVPQDTNKTNGTYPIPDFTIGALVHDIAREKGNNITLIFDCCYSLSGVRDEIPPGILSRVIDKKDLPPFTTYSDRTPIHGTLYGSHIADLYTQGLGSPGTETHVLLTACGYQESAFESSNRPGEYGYFSKTLLETLRSVGVNSLTYEGLIRRLSTLKTNMVQNPGCKGKNVNRILFDGQVTGARTTFIAIEVKEDAFYLQAGLVHGITPGFKYAIHSGDIFGPSDTIIGTFEVDQVDPFTARLKGGNALDLLSLYYGRQVGYGSDQAMSIYVTEDFVKAAEPSKTWSHILRGGKDSILIRPTSPGLARVILSAYGKKETMFKLTNQASVKYGIETLPPPGGPSIPPSASQVVPILSALSKWHWYLYHAPASRPLQDFLDVEFYKLHPAGGYTDGVSILEPEGENLIVGGEVNIVANPEDRYGIRLVNRSSADLYVYLLSFSPTSLAIVHKSIPPIGSRGALLPKSKALTIGYGPGGQLPFTFSIDKALRMDATILRLFVSTHQTDIEGIEQDSPFGANGASPSQGLKELFGRDAVWDVIGVNVACRRQSKKDEGNIEPFGGITLISNLEPTTEPKPEPTIIPNLDLGIIPPIGADTLAPSVLFPGSASADTSLIPSFDGVLFTGRSSTRRMVEALTSDATFLPWFRTPALTPELLLSTRCMRLRTLGSAKGPGGANSSAERDGYFEISVIGPDGLTKLSANKTEMTYYSHSASKSIEWLDGIVFGEDHELWKNLGVGDYFEVSICATGREWVCEAEMGNLIFW